MEERIKKIEEEIRDIKNILVMNNSMTLADHNGITRRLSAIEDILKERLEEKKLNFAKTWIVHRTLRKENRETYITNDSVKDFIRFTIKDTSYKTSFDRKEAMKFTREKAIELRDELNEFRKGKRYLWVVSNELYV